MDSKSKVPVKIAPLLNDFLDEALSLKFLGKTNAHPPEKTDC
jgi:hypothetical protein